MTKITIDKAVVEQALQSIRIAARVLSDITSTSKKGTRTREAWDFLNESGDALSAALSAAVPNAAKPEQGECEETSVYCCHVCFSSSGKTFLEQMIVCQKCGNKRCPKASDHRFECTGSNEIGQFGSIYTNPINSPAPAVPNAAKPEQLERAEAAALLRSIAGDKTTGLYYDQIQDILKAAALLAAPVQEPLTEGERNTQNYLAQQIDAALKQNPQGPHPLTSWQMRQLAEGLRGVGGIGKDQA